MLKYLGFIFMMIIILFLNIRWVLRILIFIFLMMLFLKEIYFEGVLFHLFGSSLGGDLIRIGLVCLSLWVGRLIIFSRRKTIFGSKGKLFLLLLSLMIYLLFILFFEVDVLGFYICFEVILIPIFLVVVGWGYQPERLQAGIYLIFYTLFASLPLLIIIIFLDRNLGGLRIIQIYFNFPSVRGLLYLIGVLAFLVKLPLFILHLWLPKAHVEAPIAGSIILAGILLKIGGYGLIRFNLYLVTGIKIFSTYLVSLRLVGIVYLRLVCLRQRDIKSLIAYSSVVHMGLVVGGVITITYFGFVGGYVLIVGHGLCSSAMFCLAVINYERLKSRSLFINKGIITLVPSFSLLWFLVRSSNIAAPPSINLLGEIILLGRVINWRSLRILGLSLGSFFKSILLFIHLFY